ncbi:MAG: DUF3316 domain-containing protein [Bacteroidales bacterium]|nr:DUF3316 domain-containing protein [Bacteroidales bacterium]
MNKLAACILLLLAVLCAGNASAQTDSTKVTTSIFTLDAGLGSQLDTYVSPVTYDGAHFRIAYENLRQNHASAWTRILEGGVEYELTHNPAGNHTMHTLLADFKWASMRSWANVPWRNFTVMVGPMAQFRGGVLYNPNNSNNVASARVNFAAGVNAMATYSTRLWHKPITLNYELTLPVVGAFFSPEYDEAYYEIYVGNRKNLAHFGWWGNRFDITNYLYADYSIGANTVLRIGYRGRVETSDVCHITTRAISHSLVIGIGCNLFSK